MRLLPSTRSCFVCGVDNPLGLKLRFSEEGGMAVCRFRPREEHAGFKGVVHGGIIATALDEAMVWACGIQARCFTYCAELSVRYIEPSPTGVELVLTGELLANRKNRVFEAAARLVDPAGRTLSTATGKYMPVPVSLQAALAADFTEDISKVWGGA